ncbi:hypothetical protein ACHAQH_006385 [Verticillium albo-atrum]
MIPYTVTVLVLLAARVAAQADFASPSWEYSGCVNIGNIAFEHTANFVDPFTPQQCQSACNGYGFAAAFVELCLCGNSVGDISSLKLEDGACNNPCQGDVKLGFCGHMDADGSYANVILDPSRPGATGDNRERVGSGLRTLVSRSASWRVRLVIYFVAMLK